jgi:hypothetical protein
MKAQKHDISKIKQALFYKSIGESVPVIGGGIALFALSYPFWGALCVLAGAFGVSSLLVEGRAPKSGKVISNAKLLLEMIALIAGGVTLIMLGQVAGGIACICVCAVRTVIGAIVMPLVERRYLAEAD